jgi:hypothetical protein
MVDMDGKSSTSDIRVIRIGQTGENLKLLAFPNPVINEVRLTIPQAWQDKSVTYQVMNSHGQVLKSYSVQRASQTETINMQQMPAGMYILKASNGTETGTQMIIKSSN